MKWALVAEFNLKDEGVQTSTFQVVRPHDKKVSKLLYQREESVDLKLEYSILFLLLLPISFIKRGILCSFDFLCYKIIRMTSE